MPLLFVGFGILLLLALILLKVKPLYALVIVSVVVGLAEGLSLFATVQSIGFGVLDTLRNIALVLCLGAMFGKMIETSKAATTITTSLIQWFGEKNIHWAIMLTGLIVGIPLFYNAGFVILIPLVFATASVARVPLLWVGIPMAASLSVTHGFLPPHPGPTAIAGIFHADLGLTLLYGLIITIPTVIMAGPLFANALRKLSTALPPSTAQSASTCRLAKAICEFLYRTFSGTADGSSYTPSIMDERRLCEKVAIVFRYSLHCTGDFAATRHFYFRNSKATTAHRNLSPAFFLHQRYFSHCFSDCGRWWI
jgi:H+/gluconate symporter-like permease